MARGVGQVVVKILGDASSFKSAVGEVDATASRLDSRFKKVAAATTSVLGGIGVTALAKSAVNAAAEEGQQMAVLASTLRKATGARKDDIDSVEEWITKMQNATGIADGELRPALGKLVIAGRSVAQAQKDLAVAADVARARHVSLETVVNAMSKAAQGNVGAFGRLGIATKDASGATLTYDQILQNASRTMGGAAAAAADTAAGKAEILRLRMEDLQENIGQALIPILEKLTSALTVVTAWFNNLSPGMQKTILIIGALLVVLGPLVTLVSSVTAVVGGLSAAFAFLAANPIVLVIAAVAALVAGLVIAYKKSETFRDIVNGAFAAVRVAVETVWKVIRPIFELWKRELELISGAAGKVGKVIGAIGKVGGAVGGVIGKIPGFADGGVMPGPRGKHSLAWVAGGETILPTHKGGVLGGKVELHMHSVEGADFEANADYAARTLGWRLGLAGGL